MPEPTRPTSSSVFYRYECATPARFRLGLNRYGRKVIGAYAVVGRWAYCVKWTSA
jgi:hypothetical protein